MRYPESNVRIMSFPKSVSLARNKASPFHLSNKHRELKYCRDNNIPSRRIRVSGVSYQRLERLKSKVDPNLWYRKPSMNDVIRLMLDHVEQNDVCLRENDIYD